MKRFTAPLAATLILGLAACDGGDSDDDELARVDDLTFDSNTVRRGDTVRLDVDFTFASEAVNDDNRNVIIKIAVPAGLLYEPNSAEVDKIADDDDVDPESIERCIDGTNILTFDLDQDDLRGVDDPAGDADGTLSLTLLATEVAGTVSVGARAGYDFTVASCEEGMVPEAVAVIHVTP